MKNQNFWQNHVAQYGILPSLIINWDQTGLHIVPVSQWTMAKEGSKRVEIAGSEDKRQITGMLLFTDSINTKQSC